MTSQRCCAIGAVVIGVGGFAAPSAADTIVGGPIFGDTTWDAAGSPYVISSSVLVGTGSTLTIEAGVEVRVDPGLGITVGSQQFGPGALQVLGTAQDPVLFTSSIGAPDVPAPGDWLGIQFTTFAEDAVYAGDLFDDGSILQHCIIEYAGSGPNSTGAVTMESSAPYLSFVEVRDCARSGLHAEMVTAPALRVEDCYIHDCADTSQNGGGLYLNNGANHVVTRTVFEANSASSGAGAFISNVSGLVFTDNTLHANAANSSAGGGYFQTVALMTCTGNAATSNTASNYAAYYISGASSGVFDDNLVQSNSAGSSVGGLYIDGASLQVTNCEILDNSSGGGGIGGLYVGGGANITVSSNTISGNVTNGDGGGFFFSGSAGLTFSENIVTGNTTTGSGDHGGGVYHNSGNTATYLNNTISGNAAGDQGGGMWLQGTGHVVGGAEIADNVAAGAAGGVFVNGPSITFSANTIVDNTATGNGGGVFVNQPGCSLAGASDFSDCNTITGNAASAGAAVYNNLKFSAEGAGDVDASYVCWGTADPVVIAAMLYDYFDNANRGVIITMPDVGGPVVSDTTWTLAGSPYAVNQSIVIGAGARLTIEPGVEVRFAPNTAITVGSDQFGPGELVAIGTPADPIRFTSGVGAPDVPAPGDWKEILFADNAVDAAYDEETGDYLDGSTLQHVIVEYAGSGNNSHGAVTLQSASPYLAHVEVRDAARSGVHAEMANAPALRLEDSFIHDCADTSQNGGGLYLNQGAGHIIARTVFSGNAASSGAGAFISNVSGLVLLDNAFEGNAANSSAGGAYLQTVSQMSATGNVATGNTASNYAGYYISGASNGLFDGNEVRENAAGSSVGGAYLDGAGLQVSNCQFVDNTSGGGGIGGLYVGGGAGIIVSDNEIAGNTTNGDGGGFFFSGSAGLTFSGNVVTGNFTTGSGDHGGGIYHNSGNSAAYTDNVIDGNTAGDQGGGVWMQGTGHVFGGCQITNNFCPGAGGGVFVNGQNATFSGCVITGNQALASGGGLFVDDPGCSLAGDVENQVYNCLFDNAASTGADIYNDVPFESDGDGDVNATFVCWDTDNQGEIQGRIHDFFDDPTLGFVLTFPLTDPADCTCGDGPPPCPTDLSGDGMTGAADLAALLAAWGPCPGCPADFDDSGVVDAADLAALLAAWGACP